jgi:hypothetical protein
MLNAFVFLPAAGGEALADGQVKIEKTAQQL